MSITNASIINKLLIKHNHTFASIVDFDKKYESVLNLDFTAQNTSLTAEIINNTHLFCEYINAALLANNAKFGVGGYLEHRTVYARSKHFDGEEGEPRRLHLGVDIWGNALTPVYSFMDAKIHSFANNNNFGDYGATIILEHELDEYKFYSLYGHLSLQSLAGLNKGKEIKKGTHFCDFGVPDENGHWPPHLHFQLMTTMDGKQGDYPGVGKFSEKELWANKIPDANLLLRF
ncbi:peptidoglycan DD-metalloendopeptidase family protein [Pedobacter alpinus]|uniref:Peptidoglycan DD-metalloendopeptidase family protein n=1 Tax=Pedobacter alpinus TaxID=1590643 RepID=A0ABW5TVM3_9SPHI